MPDECLPLRDDLTPVQDAMMVEKIRFNIQRLNAMQVLTAQNSATVTYAFPLRLAPGLPDSAGYRVSAFSDHNANAGQVLDYNGGSRTYDGHRGTDYALWPFSWNKVDAGDVQVIAAAAGTIVYLANVDPSDHNCGSGSSDPWNYVALRHADGRLTIYGHMRYNSLTNKGIGQSVAQGEYLGTAASSGNSSGPHLHFEVRFGGYSSAEWVDPYAGPYSQAGSLWTNQLPYFDSAINKLSTHTAPPSSPDPCLAVITHLQDYFSTPTRVYVYAYYRDFQGALPTHLKLFRPDGSLYASREYLPGANIFGAAWSQGWTFDLTSSDPSGSWRVEAAYNGKTETTYFNLNAALVIQVSSPNGGEQFDRQLVIPIVWADNIGGEVNISLYRDGVYLAPIVFNTPSDGEYLWTPANTLAYGAGYTIRVASVINPGVMDFSASSFSFVESVLVARNDLALTRMDTPILLDVLANDTSPDQAELTISGLTQPLHGQVSVVNTDLLFTPEAGYLGPAVFSYTASTVSENASAAVTVVVAAEIFSVFSPLIQR